jgi:hypothetical protein
MQYIDYLLEIVAAKSLLLIIGTTCTAPLEYSYSVTNKFHGAVFENHSAA